MKKARKNVPTFLTLSPNILILYLVCVFFDGNRDQGDSCSIPCILYVMAEFIRSSAFRSAGDRRTYFVDASNDNLSR